MADAKGKKLRRCSKQKVFYATQPRITERNQKRTLRRHLRAHPMDEQGMKLYEQRHGNVSTIGISAKGARRQVRYKNASRA